MSVVTAYRARHTPADALPTLTGAAEDVMRAAIVRRQQIAELRDLIDTYQRVVPWHRRPVDDQFLRARQTALDFYRRATIAAEILAYYDPGYSPQS